jgi:hypothetical protein
MVVIVVVLVGGLAQLLIPKPKLPSA